MPIITVVVHTYHTHTYTHTYVRVLPACHNGSNKPAARGSNSSIVKFCRIVMNLIATN